MNLFTPPAAVRLTNIAIRSMTNWCGTVLSRRDYFNGYQRIRHSAASRSTPAADWPWLSDVFAFYAHLFGAPALRIRRRLAKTAGFQVISRYNLWCTARSLAATFI